jgi:high-affinity nickel permease
MISALVILSLGLLLGVRHATDPDHIIAVSTIVSRERSLARAARIGALWGLGHTATIGAVGALPTFISTAIEFTGILTATSGQHR